MTNYERIKKAEPNDLIDLLSSLMYCLPYESNKLDFNCFDKNSCSQCIKKWLFQDYIYSDKNKEIGELLDWLKSIEDDSITGDCIAVSVRDIKKKIDMIMNK